jgi:hypothetical protein
MVKISGDTVVCGDITAYKEGAVEKDRHDLNIAAQRNNMTNQSLDTRKAMRERSNTVSNKLNTKEKKVESIKTTAVKLREQVRPYDKYIISVAVLLVIDHFLLKGAGKDKIQELGKALSSKLTKIIDKGIEKLG